MPRALTPGMRGRLALSGTLRENGITRIPKPRPCAGCGVMVAISIDELIANRLVALDLRATTSAGEVASILAGLGPCWDVDDTTPREPPTKRWHPEAITDTPADAYRVHPEHVCGWTWPVNAGAPPLFSPPAHRQGADPDEPIPF